MGKKTFIKAVGKKKIEFIIAKRKQVFTKEEFDQALYD